MHLDRRSKTCTHSVTERSRCNLPGTRGARTCFVLVDSGRATPLSVADCACPQRAPQDAYLQRAVRGLQGAGGRREISTSDATERAYLHNRILSAVLKAMLTVAIWGSAVCVPAPASTTEQSLRKAQTEIKELRAAYTAFNRGDLDAAVRSFDANVLWIEPSSFPGGGVYHGPEEVKRYLRQSKDGAASVISVPERFVVVRHRIVVFVHAKIQANGKAKWRDVYLADVYKFKQGRVSEMRAFPDPKKALAWAQNN